MLYARMVTASIAHGKIVSIDSSAAEKHPGVRAVHIIQHVQGVAELRNPALEIPSRYPIIRYLGQPVAGIAAVTQDIADDAAALVKIQYAPLPFVVERTAARAADAPLVYPGPADEAGTAGGGGGPRNVPQTGNVHGPQRKQVGDPEQGFKDADVVVEGEYFTQVQTHSALETHGVVADWKPDELTVYASTQGTASVRDELADIFKLPKNKIRVITEYMGGGFGAKFGAGNEGRGGRAAFTHGEGAGPADARPPPGAHRLQSAGFASDAAHRRQARWHTDGDPTHQLRYPPAWARGQAPPDRRLTCTSAPTC